MKALALSLFLGAPIVAGCNDGSGGSGNIPSTGSGTILGLTTDNRLVSFDPGAAGTLLGSRPVSGLPAGEELVALDHRPGTGELFALGSTSRLYTLDAASGIATSLGAAPFAPALGGTDSGFDFNPVVDRIRAVSDSDQNLRLNPSTGAVASADAVLAFDAADPNAGVDPVIVASAYTNSFAGATSTTLFAIDAGLDVLVRQGSPGGAPVSPNAGTLFTVGALGFDTSGEVGFDVSAFGGAFASLSAPGATASQLYSVDLATGAATRLGEVGGGRVLRDIAIVPPAAPRVFALSETNDLLSFRPSTPGTLLGSVAITGLRPGEDVVGLDFRPATGTLVALGDTSRVYALDTSTGVATEIGAGPFAPLLAGTDFGADFNPVPDRLRVVSDANENARLNPNSGAVAATDTALAYDAGDANAGVDPTVVAAAYTSSFAGASSTTLYGIDSALDVLVGQGSLGGSPLSPNAGLLFTIGALGPDATPAAGLDVSSLGGALAVLTAPGAADSQLHAVNLATGAATLLGTIGGGERVRDVAIEPPAPPLVFAVSGASTLVSFRPGTPGVLQSSVAIGGLRPGEAVLALDFRPSTRALYALGDTSRLYEIDRASGRAAQVGSGTLATALDGLEFGLDFNPVVDRIRVVSDDDQNLRLHPVTGAVAGVDASLAYDAGDANAGADPELVAAAYSSSFAGTTSTTLYGVDAALDVLVTQGSPGGAPVSPNLGLLFTVGSLGVDASGAVGFDVSTQGGAFLAITAPAALESQLYTVNLTTGVATLVGTIGTHPIRGLAVVPAGL